MHEFLDSPSNLWTNSAVSALCALTPIEVAQSMTLTGLAWAGVNAKTGGSADGGSLIISRSSSSGRYMLFSSSGWPKYPTSSSSGTDCSLSSLWIGDACLNNSNLRDHLFSVSLWVTLLDTHYSVCLFIVVLCCFYIFSNNFAQRKRMGIYYDSRIIT